MSFTVERKIEIGRVVVGICVTILKNPHVKIVIAVIQIVLTEYMK